MAAVYNSPRKDLDMDVLHLITLQSIQELANDQIFSPLSSSISLNNGAHCADQHPDCSRLDAYCCRMDDTYGVSHLPQTACVCDKKRLLPNSKAVVSKVMKFPQIGRAHV